MRRGNRSSLSIPQREYEYTNESRFRLELESDLNRLYKLISELENVSGSSVSKGVFRKNAPFFRASITDF